MYTYTHMCVYIHVYIYIERERVRESALASAVITRGNHLSNTTSLTQVFFKSDE